MKPVPPDKILANVLVNIFNERKKDWKLHLDAKNDVRVWNDADTNPQNQWVIKREPGTEYFKIINAGNGLELHMDAKNDVRGWHTGDSNLWQFIDPESVLYPAGWYIIKNQKTGLQLHMDANDNVVGWNTESKGQNQWNIVIAGSTTLDRIEYHTDELKLATKPSNVITLKFNNNADSELKPTWQESYKRATFSEHTFTWEFGYSFSQTLTFNATVVGIGLSGEMTQRFEMKVGGSNTSGNSVEQGWTFTLPTTVPPRRKVVVTVVLREATVTMPFTAHFSSGSTKWTERGTYDGVRYGDLEVDVQDVGPAVPGEPPISVA